MSKWFVVIATSTNQIVPLKLGSVLTHMTSPLNSLLRPCYCNCNILPASVDELSSLSCRLLGLNSPFWWLVGLLLPSCCS